LKGIAGLVLAAGASSRMGTPKQLLPAGGGTLLDRVLSEALRSDLERIVLVLGFKARAIAKGLKTDLRHPKLRIIENRNYRQGMGSSLAAGLWAVEKDFDAVMILLGDMPHVTAGLINLLVQRCLQSGSPLAALTSGGRRSHPVIIGRPFFPDLHGLEGDEGAKRIFAEHADQVLLVEPPGEYDDTDIDTPDEYRAFQRKRKRMNSS